MFCSLNFEKRRENLTQKYEYPEVIYKIGSTVVMALQMSRL